MAECPTMRVALKLNGHQLQFEVEPRTLLVELIRENAGLTGTHVGCDTSYCGACTVVVDGRSAKSCTVLALQADGAEVTTVEGLETPEGLHILQQSFAENHALQCGFCTPGFLMSALALLSVNADPDEAAIRKAFSGNTCRCTGYLPIIAAVKAAAVKLKETAQ
ncbi:(2Fe-2S)-binding protein [Mesorhizobium sp. M8A.F.Ca.ET.173.01.1.1]|nr:(2Fe-2S)-binding protein [Mesorhizobium sp. M8A.F.Ca.ET.173.01.1.1]